MARPVALRRAAVTSAVVAAAAMARWTANCYSNDTNVLLTFSILRDKIERSKDLILS